MKKLLALILSLLILGSAGFYTFRMMNDLSQNAQNPATVVEEKKLTDGPNGIPFPPPDEG